MSGGHIYILGGHTGRLYIGVTSNLYSRIMQHKEGALKDSLRTMAASACSILRATRTPHGTPGHVGRTWATVQNLIGHR
jgi:predicted GIY-YIG superfamily endonuclease